MRDHLRLFINGKPVRVCGEDAFLTLSDYLRLRARLTGTKVVCAEGDCGACAALIGRVIEGRLRYAPVTSCIMMMFQLDGCHVITIEGLKHDNTLNPIQEAMVACHGAQCGFCTPGFVVSLHSLLENRSACDAQAVRRGLVGNLCRCTGYDSIIDAAMHVDLSRLRAVDTLYPPAEMLGVLVADRAEDVLIRSRDRSAYKPATLAQALHFRAANPAAVVVSGATDLGVLHGKQIRRLDSVLFIGDLDELRGHAVSPDMITIGAGATISDLERLCETAIPELAKFLAWFGSPLIKSGGSIAGNLVTGSPIGDTLPPLMVLGTEIELTATSDSGSVSRRAPIGDFYTGYRRTVLAPSELVTAVRIPIPSIETIFRLFKVSRRKDLDISTFSAAIKLDMRRGTIPETIGEIAIAYGGVGPTVLRMIRTEAALRGQRPTLEIFEHAADIAAAEVTPISDVRGSEQYRRAVAGNILLRFWHENFSNIHGLTGSPPMD
ncbi:MAG: FAD binding domain-containing protein [Burkholderiales bacterium]|nr:FAD binding domain-containing protein [Phycisphaerae bacterium]